jgi:UDP-glucose:(heptosyl)LPS alpha-1,3-glucosyltransferase
MKSSFPFRRVAFLRRGWSTTGGAEAYLGRLSAGLAEAGVELRLFGSGVDSAAWPYGPILNLPGSDPLTFARAFAAQPREYDELLFSLERVPDCHVFRAGDGVHAAWLRRRRLFSPWWKNLWRAASRRHRQLLALEKQVLDPQRTRLVIANSLLVRNEILAASPFPPERVVHIPNGVPLPDLSACGDPVRQREDFRRKQGIPTEAFVALFVGSGWERKGLRQAMAMVAREGHTHLVVAGKGPAGRFAQSGVHHLGPVHDLTPVWLAADVFLLPTWYDPFSNASLEALAAGLPVITTRDNGCAEVLQEGATGSILPRTDAVEDGTNALAFWREKVRSDPAAVRVICQKAANPWSMERNIEQTLECLSRWKTA